jgi:FlaA1/EpsC-like NDP-sugar epimerase
MQLAFIGRFLSLPRRAKQALALALDVSLCLLALKLAILLRLDNPYLPIDLFAIPAILSVAIAAPIFVLFGLYNGVFRYSGILAITQITRTLITYGLLYAAIFSLVVIPGVPRSIGVMQPIILLVLIGISRWLVRLWFGNRIERLVDDRSWQSIVIYGVGDAGRQLVSGVANTRGWKLAGLIDDDRNLWAGTIDGYRVYAPSALPEIVKCKAVSEVWLAMPNINSTRRRELIESLRPLGVHVRSLPTLSDLASGRIKLSDVQELDINDLLGRAPVTPNATFLNRAIREKTILVTGAGGSIGSELCRKIIALRPAKLILVDHSEFSLYVLHRDLSLILRKQSKIPESDSNLTVNGTLIPMLVSVTDEITMKRLFEQWRPQTVFHAAAYKHVPMVELNIRTAVENNVWGTLICCRQAFLNGVETFVLVSTDKAVRPTNVMGVTKRLAELIIQAFASRATHSDPSFSAVRFGNVLGSSGSVAPLFRDQINRGGPVTLTHPDITRYFMTISEAAELVLQAGGISEGGEVFVLDMGQPVRIYDLARRMIEFSGQTVLDEKNPRGQIEIQVTGLRPGEKLYEELLIGGNPEGTIHPKIMKARETFIPLETLEAKLETLRLLVLGDDVLALRQALVDLVPEYAPAGEVVDWTVSNPAA